MRPVFFDATVCDAEMPPKRALSVIDSCCVQQHPESNRIEFENTNTIAVWLHQTVYPLKPATLCSFHYCMCFSNTYVFGHSLFIENRNKIFINMQRNETSSLYCLCLVENSEIFDEFLRDSMQDARQNIKKALNRATT